MLGKKARKRKVNMNLYTVSNNNCIKLKLLPIWGKIKVEHKFHIVISFKKGESDLS